MKKLINTILGSAFTKAFLVTILIIALFGILAAFFIPIFLHH